MTRLRTSDLEGALGFLGEVDALEGDVPFPAELLERLGALVPCESVYFLETDIARGRIVAHDAWDLLDEFPICTEGSVEAWTSADPHPFDVFRRRADYLGAILLSDFYGRARRLRHDVYFPDYHARRGIVDVAEIRLALSSARTVDLGIETASRDFGERDRRVFDLVRPRLAARYEEVHRRRLLADTLAALEATSVGDKGPAVVLLGTGGDIQFATERALTLLGTYFGTNKGRLPSAVDEWWRAHPAEPLVRRQNGLRVVLELVGRTALVLTEEVAPSVALTAREWDVMRCVEAGRTNEEIARLLWISPSTVKKHLEHVYEKLGVRTRTAALARLRLRSATSLEPERSEERAESP